MSKQLVKINNTDLSVKEFNGQRVVIFKDIDMLHERVEGTAKRNFSDNKKHFIKNIDYYELSKNDVGTDFVLSYGFDKKAPKGILITESGYLMLVKSLQDDLAWKVQRELVNNYFRVKDVVNIQKVINEFKGQLQIQFDEIVQAKIDEIEKKCSNYYRPSALEKSNISHYIKERLSISKANDEYELVKERVLIKLGATKWEDVDVQTLKNSLNIIDESIRIIKLDRPQQTSLWD